MVNELAGLISFYRQPMVTVRETHSRITRLDIGSHHMALLIQSLTKLLRLKQGMYQVIIGITIVQPKIMLTVTRIHFHSIMQ